MTDRTARHGEGMEAGARCEGAGQWARVRRTQTVLCKLLLREAMKLVRAPQPGRGSARWAARLFRRRHSSCTPGISSSPTRTAEANAPLGSSGHPKIMNPALSTGQLHCLLTIAFLGPITKNKMKEQGFLLIKAKLRPKGETSFLDYSAAYSRAGGSQGTPWDSQSSLNLKRVGLV